MIRYTLTCDQKHQFESWFQSSAAFDSLADSGHLSCTICGSKHVKRALMAPSVPTKGNKKNRIENETPDLSKPQSDVETAMTKMRKDVEDNSDYVGMKFADEARKMHDGDAPERAIYGEAKLDDAKKLIEDGIPVAPLPFMPKRKTN